MEAAEINNQEADNSREAGKRKELPRLDLGKSTSLAALRRDTPLASVALLTRFLKGLPFQVQ